MHVLDFEKPISELEGKIAVQALKIAVQDLNRLGVIDAIIHVPVGGAPRRDKFLHMAAAA
jgi:acetyl-CoA carboxylase alpha subunit